MLEATAFETSLAFEDILPPDVLQTVKKHEICEDYQRGRCLKGDACPMRHVLSSFRTVQSKVCKHWLRGACVNGENCLYLHEYDTRFVPSCAFYDRLGECTNPECPFPHVHPMQRQPECAAYTRGFCPLGPQCKLKHTPKKQACVFYLAGFCPLGPHCPDSHPVQQCYNRAAVAERILQRMLIDRAGDPTFNRTATCFRAGCMDPGHLAPHCPGPQYSQIRRHLSEIQEAGEQAGMFEEEARGSVRRCFVCHAEGHTMRDCPKNTRSGGGGGGGHNRAGGGGGREYGKRAREFRE